MSQKTVILFGYKGKRSTERTSARWEGPGQEPVSGGSYSYVFCDFVSHCVQSHVW